MCRYCLKYTNPDDFNIAFKTHDIYEELARDFKRLEKQLIYFMEISPKDIACEVDSYHKHVVKIRKDFNKAYAKFLKT